MLALGHCIQHIASKFNKQFKKYLVEETINKHGYVYFLTWIMKYYKLSKLLSTYIYYIDTTCEFKQLTIQAKLSTMRYEL